MSRITEDDVDGLLRADPNPTRFEGDPALGIPPIALAERSEGYGAATITSSGLPLTEEQVFWQRVARHERISGRIDGFLFACCLWLAGILVWRLWSE